VYADCDTLNLDSLAAAVYLGFEPLDALLLLLLLLDVVFGFCPAARPTLLDCAADCCCFSLLFSSSAKYSFPLLCLVLRDAVDTVELPKAIIESPLTIVGERSMFEPARTFVEASKRSPVGVVKLAEVCCRAL
jgi:hypothetical protein